MNTGTPKTLAEAISMGITGKDGVEAIERSVRDFLAQHVQSARFEAETKHEDELISRLWFRVTGKQAA